MLIMAAAFLPRIAETVDLGKLPPPEVVTKHLSPTVLSQRYEGHGYLISSIGSVSAFQAVLGVATASGAGATFYQRQFGATPGTAPPTAATPTPIPTETPELEDDTP
jgi:hypothetical protein